MVALMCCLVPNQFALRARADGALRAVEDAAEARQVPDVLGRHAVQRDDDRRHGEGRVLAGASSSVARQPAPPGVHLIPHPDSSRAGRSTSRRSSTVTKQAAAACSSPMQAKSMRCRTSRPVLDALPRRVRRPAAPARRGRSPGPAAAAAARAAPAPLPAAPPHPPPLAATRSIFGCELLRASAQQLTPHLNYSLAAPMLYSRRPTARWGPRHPIQPRLARTVHGVAVRHDHRSAGAQPRLRRKGGRADRVRRGPRHDRDG